MLGEYKLVNLTANLVTLEAYGTENFTTNIEAVTWIQNYTANQVNCPSGYYVSGRYRNGTFNCSADQDSGSSGLIKINNSLNNETANRINNDTLLQTQLVLANHTIHNETEDRMLGAYKLANLTANLATLEAYATENFTTNIEAVTWIQNYTANQVNCPSGYYVSGRYRNGTFNCSADQNSIFNPSDLAYVNQTQLGGISYINTTMFDNSSIIRSWNTSWIGDNGYIPNNSNARLGLLNVTVNLTISNGSSGNGNIWHNGSGICIGSC